MFQQNPLGGFGYTFVLRFKVGMSHIVFHSVSFSGFFHKKNTTCQKMQIFCSLLYALWLSLGASTGWLDMEGFADLPHEAL